MLKYASKLNEQMLEEAARLAEQARKDGHVRKARMEAK